MAKYDYLLVGAGLFNATLANELKKRNKRCLVIDKRNHVGGNVYTEEQNGIQVHKYGAHIFHTSNKTVWDYVNQFAEFNRFTNSPKALYKGKLYSLPFNMNTFYEMWGVVKPEEAKKIIAEQVEQSGIAEPRNLEEQAIKLVGKDIYYALVKEYTEKQWGKDCAELPAFIIKRLPLRFSFDNNYFNDKYQGIPIGGYTQIIEKMLDGCDVKLNCDFFAEKKELSACADRIVFCGPIDAYYDYRFGELEYRSLRFETEQLDVDNYQGNAVVNYTDKSVLYTRIIEHKHFDLTDNQKGTIITREYPSAWRKGDEPFYSVNDEKNAKLYAKYNELAKREKKVFFKGRLGEYRYYDMHVVVEKAIEFSKELEKSG